MKSLRLILFAAAAVGVLACGAASASATAPTVGEPSKAATWPVWSEQIVTASDVASVITFGYTVALSGDTALIGTQGEGAYVFERHADGWRESVKLAAAGAPTGFGHRVAVDGDRAVVSASPNLVGDLAVRNSVHVFERAGDDWIEVAKLASHEQPSTDRFGSAVAIKGDVILVGAYKATLDEHAPMQGAAYLYRRVGGQWQLSTVLSADDGRANEYFGMSVALDDGTALVGARDATIDRYRPRQGAAYLFEDVGGRWAQSQKLFASDGGDSFFFGSSVALDGGQALIGAPNTQGNGQFQGAAYLYRRSDAGFELVQKLRGTNGREIDQFGISVALSGPTALVGAYLAEVDGRMQQGAVHAFAESESGWVQTDRLLASDGAANAHFGWSLALDGGTALTGAHLASVGGSAARGKGYFLGFTRSPSLRLGARELRFEIDAGTGASAELDIGNAGDAPLDYAIAESAVAARAGVGSAPIAAAVSAVAPIRAGGTVGPRSGQAPWRTEVLDFVLDDGSYEDTITLNQGNGEASALWMNRFTVPQGTGAFTLGTISVLWPTSANGSLVGKQVNLVAYHDADGDGDPVDAVRIGSDHFVTIEESDAVIDHVVNFPVPGDGDLYIGFESSYARGGWTPRLFPAAIDTDSAPQQRSWLAGRIDGDVRLDALADNHYLGLIDIFGISGNWLIRGRGIDASNDCVEASEVPWLVVAAASGSVEAAGEATVVVGVDAADLAPGNYAALLCVSSNDPALPLARVPVRLQVNPPGLIFRDGFETR